MDQDHHDGCDGFIKVEYVEFLHAPIIREAPDEVKLLFDNTACLWYSEFTQKIRISTGFTTNTVMNDPDSGF